MVMSFTVNRLPVKYKVLVLFYMKTNERLERAIMAISTLYIIINLYSITLYYFRFLFFRPFYLDTSDGLKVYVPIKLE